MLITVQPCFLAASYSVRVNMPFQVGSYGSAMSLSKRVVFIARATRHGVYSLESRQADHDLKTAEASIGPHLRAIHSVTHA